MDDLSVSNNGSNGHVDVRFGDAPGNVLALETVTEMLRLMHGKAPEEFGYWCAFALAGVAPKAKRGQ